MTDKEQLIDGEGSELTIVQADEFLCMKHGHTTHIISFKLPSNQKTYCIECLASWLSKNFDAVEPVDGD